VIERIGLSRLVAHLVHLSADQVIVIIDFFLLPAVDRSSTSVATLPSKGELLFYFFIQKAVLLNPSAAGSSS
jgi:hypothetical protein